MLFPSEAQLSKLTTDKSGHTQIDVDINCGERCCVFIERDKLQSKSMGVQWRLGSKPLWSSKNGQTNGDMYSKLMNGSGRRTNKTKTKRNQRSSSGGLHGGKQPINQAPTPARRTNTHPTSTLNMVNFLCFLCLFLFSLRSRRLRGRCSLRQFQPLSMLAM